MSQPQGAQGSPRTGRASTPAATLRTQGLWEELPPVWGYPSLAAQNAGEAVILTFTGTS